MNKPEERLAVTVILCAALIGAAVFLRDANITALAVAPINLPPEWISTTTTFTVEQGELLQLDLNTLFRDPEGKPLTFRTTETENIVIELNDNQLTIIPNPRFVGERVISVSASNGNQITQKYVKIQVVITRSAS